MQIRSPFEFSEPDEISTAPGVQPGGSPLTPMQLGLIYESNMVDRPWVNLEQVVCRLNDERVDLKAMTRAWRLLVARHAILRTTIHWRGREEPEQRVQKTADIDVQLVDLSDVAAEGQDAKISDWLAQDRNRGVNLEQAPNWRVTWFQLGARRSVLVWTFHHALLDGRGFARLTRDLLEFYADFCSECVPHQDSDEKAASFAKYCQALSETDLSAAAEYFQSKLAGFDAPNRVDLGASDTATTDRKRLVERVMPEPFGAQLTRRAMAAEVTVATLVNAAWGLIVARCSNRDEAVFGVTRSGGHLIAGGTDIAGCLINTIPARIKASPDTTIDSLLCDLRADQLAVRPHEHAPLTDITGWSELPAGTALFETAVMFERGSLNGQMQAKGGLWQNRRFEVLEEGALPLTLAVYQDAEMTFRLEYDPSRYSSSCATRLLDYMIAALEQIQTLPGDTKLIQLDMLPEAERSYLMSAGCGRAEEPPSPVHCLASRFEYQARRQPGKVALAMPGDPNNVSYDSLDRQANRLANLIKSRGVGAGDLVAICLPRSSDFVTAMLGVIKSGAAFLPIDPSYPRPAIDHMLKDSGAALMISSQRTQPENCDIPTILLAGVAALANQPDTAPNRAGLDPDRTAYVIYTSGSTGTPKGVAVSHAAFGAYVAAISDSFELSQLDQVAQIAGLSFDVSLEEILPTLLCGAGVVLRTQEMVESMSALLEATAKYELTVLNLPTALWHELVDHFEMTGARLPAAVRLVIIGGEGASPVHFAKWRQMVPNVRLLNGYGLTEATVTATVFDAQASENLASGEDVPIGRPLANSRAYVLCPDGSLAPNGAKAELWLGGASVATGYLGRPDVTAERFAGDRFTSVDQPGTMYRTGDMVRWRSDGNLAYLGRGDRQVKVNGYRIELREIEKALESLDNVGLALVEAEQTGVATARLLAWVTPTEPERKLDAVSVRDALKKQLPAYKVPSILVLPSFPTTPGGKIDVKALPRPAARADADEAEIIPCEIVKKISTMFSGLLGDVTVGPDSSFFDLGGHSLLAVRLIGQIEMAFGRRLSVTQLHAAASPRAIAGLLGEPAPSDVGEYLVPIQPSGVRPPLFGVHVLGKGEGFFRPLAAALGPEQPVLGLSVGLLTEDVPTGVEETARVYFNEIQRHYPDGPVYLAAVSQGSYIAFELAQQLIAAGREVGNLVLFDAAGPAGRPRLTGKHRILQHRALLRQTGPRYLAKAFGNRLSRLRNRIEKAKIAKAQKSGGNGLNKLTVEKFVAANTLAIEAYSAKPCAAPITVLRARESVFDTEAAIQSGLGWRPLAQGGLDLFEVSGGHLSMLEDPHVDVVADRIRRIIGESV